MFDTKLGKVVAAKRIFDNEDELLHEARTLATFNHPNILKVHGLARSQEANYEGPAKLFLIADWVDGLSLEKKIREGLDFNSAVKFIRQIGDAVSYVNSRNILYADLKDSNILIDDTDNVVLLDFGIARKNKRGAKTALMSVFWAAPEQELDGSVSLRSEVFSQASLIFKVLGGLSGDSYADTKRTEFLKNTDMTLPLKEEYKVFFDRYPNNLDELTRIIRKGFQKRPKDRYESVEVMNKEVNAVLGDLLK